MFVANEPVPLKKLCEITEISPEDCQDLLAELREDYRRENRGLQIIEVAGGFMMATRPEFASYIERLYRPQGSSGLSRAALETLAIVAYKQPVTRGDLELIRGVKVDRAIHTLLEKDLVQEVGRREGAGRPVLFGTTDRFLRHFGLNSVSDLPSLEDFISRLEEEDAEQSILAELTREPAAEE